LSTGQASMPMQEIVRLCIRTGMGGIRVARPAQTNICLVAVALDLKWVEAVPIEAGDQAQKSLFMQRVPQPTTTYLEEITIHPLRTLAMMIVWIVRNFLGMIPTLATQLRNEEVAAPARAVIIQPLSVTPPACAVAPCLHLIHGTIKHANKWEFSHCSLQ
jgi:hypothetical protein